MKKSSKIAILALTLVGGTALISTSVYAMWAVFQKEDTSASFDEVHYTVSFYADESQSSPLYTYPGLEIDSEFPLPVIEDTSTKHFKGWKEKGGTAVYSSSLKLSDPDLTTLDKTNHTLSLYGAYDSILTITVKPNTTLVGNPSSNVSVILNEDPLVYLLSNLGMPLEAQDSKKVDYHLVSFTSTLDLSYKHLKSDGTYEEAMGKTFALNDALVLSSSSLKSNLSLSLTANYVEVLS